MSNVLPIRDTFSRKVHVPGPLSEAEDFRSVAMTREQAELVEEHGLYLLRQGAHEKAAKFLALHLAWRFGRSA